VPPGAREPPSYPLNNARSDKLGTWPWKAMQRRRCLIPVSGLLGAGKPAREKGVAPWSYYSMKDELPFWIAGLWSEAPDPGTGEIADSYTMVIGDANAAMRVHDRMPVILATYAARRWVEPGPLPAELLVPYPADATQAWRVGDGAKSSRLEPHLGMAEAVAT
jgi:putative SOS response-associated peptidase YedK